jgi:haloacetate dehalogenase
MAPLFEDAREIAFNADGVEIFARVGGSGPPLLLIHGFPQTHAMWHRVAPALMKRFTCVMPDLRGYGRSSCPPNDAENSAYSKRAMARDLLALMDSLGFKRFAAVGHDRGGRVAYRMALDSPEAVSSLTVLDIVPTYAMWHGFTAKLAMKTYHWLFLAQPFPLPEMLIGKSPVEFLDYTMASWTKKRTLEAFDAAALADYRAAYARPDYIHASCNDYRAGQTYDLKADEADRAAGKMIACPTLAVWGSVGIPSETDGPLAAWREWCSDLRGAGIDSGHFVAEENPQALIAELMPFLESHGH